jgi:hypothetical protein
MRNTINYKGKIPLEVKPTEQITTLMVNVVQVVPFSYTKTYLG